MSRSTHAAAAQVCFERKHAPRRRSYWRPPAAAFENYVKKPAASAVYCFRAAHPVTLRVVAIPCLQVFETDGDEGDVKTLDHFSNDELQTGIEQLLAPLAQRSNTARPTRAESDIIAKAKMLAVMVMTNGEERDELATQTVRNDMGHGTTNQATRLWQPILDRLLKLAERSSRPAWKLWAGFIARFADVWTLTDLDEFRRLCAELSNESHQS